MDPHKSELERAFELARSGTCATVKDIVRRLRSERYSGSQMVGRMLNAQLRAVIAQAKEVSRSSVEGSAIAATGDSGCLQMRRRQPESLG